SRDCTSSYANLFFYTLDSCHCTLHSFPTRRSSDLFAGLIGTPAIHIRRPRITPIISVGRGVSRRLLNRGTRITCCQASLFQSHRSEEHTSELQSRENLVCRLLLEKKKNT